MAKSPKSFDVPIDRRWLVHSRCEIQTKMLELEEFWAKAKQLEMQQEVGAFYAILVGIVFSLWRAVFLIRTERSLQDEIEAAEEFLGILIDTNAIAFAQDKKTAQWTAGYYVNNALLRLHAMASLPTTKPHLKKRTMKFIGSFEPRKLIPITGSGNELSQSWERAIKGYDLVLKDATSTLENFKKK